MLNEPSVLAWLKEYVPSKFDFNQKRIENIQKSTERVSQTNLSNRRFQQQQNQNKYSDEYEKFQILKDFTHKSKYSNVKFSKNEESPKKTIFSSASNTELTHTLSTPIILQKQASQQSKITLSQFSPNIIQSTTSTHSIVRIESDFSPGRSLLKLPPLQTNRSQQFFEFTQNIFQPNKERNSKSTSLYDKNGKMEMLSIMKQNLEKEYAKKSPTTITMSDKKSGRLSQLNIENQNLLYQSNFSPSFKEKQNSPTMTSNNSSKVHQSIRIIESYSSTKKGNYSEPQYNFIGQDNIIEKPIKNKHKVQDYKNNLTNEMVVPKLKLSFRNLDDGYFMGTERFKTENEYISISSKKSDVIAAQNIRKIREKEKISDNIHIKSLKNSKDKSGKSYSHKPIPSEVTKFNTENLTYSKNYNGEKEEYILPFRKKEVTETRPKIRAFLKKLDKLNENKSKEDDNNRINSHLEDNNFDFRRIRTQNI